MAPLQAPDVGLSASTVSIALVSSAVLISLVLLSLICGCCKKAKKDKEWPDENVKVEEAVKAEEALKKTQTVSKEADGTKKEKSTSGPLQAVVKEQPRYVDLATGPRYLDLSGVEKPKSIGPKPATEKPKSPGAKLASKPASKPDLAYQTLYGLGDDFQASVRDKKTLAVPALPKTAKQSLAPTVPITAKQSLAPQNASLMPRVQPKAPGSPNTTLRAMQAKTCLSPVQSQYFTAIDPKLAKTAKAPAGSQYFG